MPDTNTPIVDDEHRECPFCAEIIKKKATLCRYCKSELPAANPAAKKRKSKRAISTNKKAADKIATKCVAKKKRLSRRTICEMCGKSVYRISIKHGMCRDCREKEGITNSQNITTKDIPKINTPAKPKRTKRQPKLGTCKVCKHPVLKHDTDKYGTCYSCFIKLGRTSSNIDDTDFEKLARNNYLGKEGKANEEPDTGSILVCPRCLTKGNVTERMVKVKTGFSTCKTSWTLVTGGLSTLLTGLAKKEFVTEAHCDACGSTWRY